MRTRRWGIEVRISFGVVTALVACALAGLAAAPALAVAPARSALPRHAAAPLIRLPQPRHGRASAWSTSTNWAGYDAAGGTFTSVTASWTQPAVAPDSSVDRYAAFWVGLDGDGSTTVEQIGTEGMSARGVARYFAWYEMYPANFIATDLEVRPGDQFTGTVTSDGAGSFTLALVNHTTGRSFTTTRHEDPLNPAMLASAEVIAETPSDRNGVLPLAKFGIVDFSQCAFNGQPVAAFSLDNITLTARGGASLAATSPLGPDGASFFVSDDFTAPVTTVRGAGAGAHGAGETWHHAPFALRFSADDGSFSSGVASTQHSEDGGVTWTTGTTLGIAAPDDHTHDGRHAVLYRSTDRAGNVEGALTVKIGVDTQRPTPLAASPASVRRGHRAVLRYRVDDPRPGAPTATVTIRIRSASGQLVKKAVLERRRVDRSLRYRFACMLPRGTYRFSVYATDAAGNVQTAAARNTLVVR
jgi:hypothetical protein